MKLLAFIGNWFFFLLSENSIDPQFFEKTTPFEKTIFTSFEDSRKGTGKECFPLANSQSKNFSTSFPDCGLGKEVFRNHCLACHNQGKNLIIPEKNLKKEALEANGMNTLNAISYQVMNGKNGMPAFGGRLLEEEIEAVSIYVLKQSSLNFKE